MVCMRKIFVNHYLTETETIYNLTFYLLYCTIITISNFGGFCDFMIRKIVLTILVIIWAGVIFNFSSQVATTSNEVSTGVTEKVVDLSPQINNLPHEKKEQLIEELNNKFRKYAHFMLFLIFGMLVISLVKSYSFKSVNAYILTLLICLLYAVSDEIHQIFVAGRGCQRQDVVIDFSGSFLGSLIILTASTWKTFLTGK